MPFKKTNEKQIFEIIEPIEVLQEAGNISLELNKVSWNKKPPTLDIRKWDLSGDSPVPLKGITLTEEGVNRLTIKLIELGYGK